MANKPIVMRKPPARQLAWQYMRRNRTFRVGDVVLVTDITMHNLHQYVKALERGGYLRCDERTYKMRDRTYTLLVDTGALAPCDRGCEIKDRNKKEPK